MSARLDTVLRDARATDPDEAEAGAASLTSQDIDEIRQAFSSFLGGGVVPRARHADRVTEMMVENVTAYAGDLMWLFRSARDEDLRSVLAANLAMGAWLRSYGVSPPLIESFTHIEGQGAARALLIGSWHAQGIRSKGGLLSGLKARRIVPNLAADQAKARAFSIGTYLRDELGLDADITQATISLVRDNSCGPKNARIAQIQKTIHEGHARQLDTFFECLSDRMKPFMQTSSVAAVMVLAQHAAFRALLAGSDSVVNS